MRVAFIREQQNHHSLRRLCKMMDVHPSGYYAWLEMPDCSRAIEDKRLLGHIKQSWLESGSVYGYRKYGMTCMPWARPAASTVSTA